jgi:mono/diheme cytochrome c family protein
MKNTCAAVLIVFATLASACGDATPEVTASAAAGGARVERGKYLVTMIGCSDCHTPLKMGPKGPQPDVERFLSGHPEQMGALPPAKAQGPWLWAGAATNTAFAGPWGVSYAANLTPDRNTGLGIWTEEMFVKAIRTGRHMGTSREILPPMPWPAFRNATDEDLKSIYAYLRTLKPVTNHVPDVRPPAAANRD